jgi:transcriptional regulator
MLIHPWDAALSTEEWQGFVRASGRFGVLAVPNGLEAPVLLPTHFTLLQEEILLHFARPNSAIKLIDEAQEVSLILIGDFAFINNQWRAKEGIPKAEGVPTSYYSAVNFIGIPTVIHDDEGIAEVLREQMKDFEPEGGHAEIDPSVSPYGPMLSGVRAVRIKLTKVEAKFKYDDHKPVDLRIHVAGELAKRNQHQDREAAKHQRERLAQIGEWKPKA